MLVYVVILAVVIAVFLLGVSISFSTASVSGPKTVTILPEGTNFPVPAANHVGVGPVNLTGQQYWNVSLSFISDWMVDFFEMNWTQYQSWSLHPGAFPSECTMDMLDTEGGGGVTIISVIPPGTFYYVWMNNNTQYSATITIFSFMATN